MSFKRLATYMSERFVPSILHLKILKIKTNTLWAANYKMEW